MCYDKANPVSLMRLETRNSLHSRMHFKLCPTHRAKGQNCPYGKATMHKYNPIKGSLYIYKLLCIFFSSEERSKDKPCKLWGCPAEVTKAPTSSCGWTKGQLPIPWLTVSFVTLKPLFIYSKQSGSCTQSPNTQQHLYRLQVNLNTSNGHEAGGKGNPSPLCLLCPCSGLKSCDT